MRGIMRGEKMRRFCHSSGLPWHLAVILGTAALGLPGAASAQQVGYAQATGYYKQQRRPTQYQPLNLLDAREATVWCSPTADTLSEQLTFGFKGPARVDEIRIYTGNGFDDSTFRDFSRARKFTFRGPRSARSVTVADQRGLQSFVVDPPLVGAFLTAEILDQYPAEDPQSPVCVTDIVFYSRGKPLNGPWLTQRLKYHRQRARLLGTWFAGHPGAPDRFLSFFFDGTWRFTHDPFEGRPRAFSGRYTVVGDRVVLELPGKARAVATLSTQSSPDDDPLGPAAGRSLRFQERAPEDFRAPYRDRR